MKKLLIFDLDGTLFDSANTLHKVTNILFERKGYTPITLDFVKSLIGEGLSHFDDKMDEHTKNVLTTIRHHEDEFVELYDEYCLESPLYEGALEYLSSCPFKLAIVSNKKENFVKKMVANTELNQFEWQTVFGGNSFEKRKPDPLPLLKTLEQTGIGAEESIMIGDGVPDILSSKAAGMDYIGVDFGYAPTQLLKSLGAQHIINHYSELPALIEKHF